MLTSGGGALLGRSHTSVRPIAVETRLRFPGGSGRSEEGRKNNDVTYSTFFGGCNI